MASNTPTISGDVTPVTGGMPLPPSMVAKLSTDSDAPDDNLGRQAWWLLKLHPDVAMKFQPCDLSAMDNDAKRQLIHDIQCALGIAPFQGDVL